ncbi:Rdx family-domain-containing protein [Annulohypoxylon truncatum]|uniref:Rdx family-domain-containing protein n=1 Tax=Annulohypoxylon truncatum TaxID=327061 RepID=UPI002008DB5A|nr:Rdx family-domain-containing protein [Annulohypoxylon truncatum]KAI1212963.1 Rdx family-domain-containing protein [Annulohypoxylon truncatum]
MAETSIAASAPTVPDSPYPLPRVTIRFCTQCKWMLRAAYFAQELLSTFSTSLGEVALQPSTGGTFVVEIVFAQPSPSPTSTSTSPTSSDPKPAIQKRVLWDRKTDGGFPETKELKRRVRDAIEPGRNLGHVDKDYHHAAVPTPAAPSAPSSTSSSTFPSTAHPQSQQPHHHTSPSSYGAAEAARSAQEEEARAKEQRRVSLAKIEKDNALGLNTHPDENIGGACRPGTESAATNAKIEGGCEDCK